jgi:hypothetical protein
MLARLMAFAVSSLLRMRRRRFRHGGSGMLLANPCPNPVRLMTSIVISLVSSGTLLAPWEKQAIIGFHQEHPLEGYRRATFMMLDADVVAVSPSSVWGMPDCTHHGG